MHEISNIVSVIDLLSPICSLTVCKFILLHILITFKLICSWQHGSGINRIEKSLNKYLSFTRTCHSPLKTSGVCSAWWCYSSAVDLHSPSLWSDIRFWRSKMANVQALDFSGNCNNLVWLHIRNRIVRIAVVSQKAWIVISDIRFLTVPCGIIYLKAAITHVYILKLFG